MLARVFNQDSFNLPKVQKGLRRMRKDITLANYQETKIRHFHTCSTSGWPGRTARPATARRAGPPAPALAPI